MAMYRNLKAWQVAHQLALETYRLTERFPRTEMFGLTSQVRRAALSVPSNLVEGYGRKGAKEFSHFINIALGSLAEFEYLMDFAADLNYLQGKETKRFRDLLEETGRLYWGLRRSKQK